MPKKSRDYVEGLIEDLKDPVMAEHYLNAAIDEPGEMFLLALRDVAESHRFARIAEDAGLSREGLYRTLSAEGNPRLNSLRAILKAMGLKLRVDAISGTSPTPEFSEARITIGGQDASAAPDIDATVKTEFTIP